MFKMTEWVEQRICIKFCIKLEHSFTKLFRWFRRPQLWATDDCQLHQDNAPTHTSHLGQTFLAKHQITQVTQTSPNPAAYIWYLVMSSAFPKTEITFEREEIADHQWDSGKYNGTADGNRENRVRSQGAYFEGDWGTIVLCTMFLVSCVFFNKCLCFSYYMAGYCLNRPHISRAHMELGDSQGLTSQHEERFFFLIWGH